MATNVLTIYRTIYYIVCKFCDPTPVNRISNDQNLLLLHETYYKNTIPIKFEVFFLHKWKESTDFFFEIIIFSLLSKSTVWHRRLTYFTYLPTGNKSILLFHRGSAAFLQLDTIKIFDRLFSSFSTEHGNSLMTKSFLSHVSRKHILSEVRTR